MIICHNQWLWITNLKNKLNLIYNNKKYEFFVLIFFSTKKIELINFFFKQKFQLLLQKINDAVCFVLSILKFR